MGSLWRCLYFFEMRLILVDWRHCISWEFTVIMIVLNSFAGLCHSSCCESPSKCSQLSWITGTGGGRYFLTGEHGLPQLRVEPMTWTEPANNRSQNPSHSPLSAILLCRKDLAACDRCEHLRIQPSAHRQYVHLVIQFVGSCTAPWKNSFLQHMCELSPFPVGGFAGRLRDFSLCLHKLEVYEGEVEWKLEREKCFSETPKQNRELQACSVYIKSDCVFSIVTSLSVLFLFSLFVAHTWSCLRTFPGAKNAV